MRLNNDKAVFKVSEHLPLRIRDEKKRIRNQAFLIRNDRKVIPDLAKVRRDDRPTLRYCI